MKLRSEIKITCVIDILLARSIMKSYGIRGLGACLQYQFVFSFARMRLHVWAKPLRGVGEAFPHAFRK